MRVSNGLTFEMARIAVGNDRQDQYRLPGIPMGTVQMGITKRSHDGDLADQHAWLEENNLGSKWKMRTGVVATHPRRGGRR